MLWYACTNDECSEHERERPIPPGEDPVCPACGWMLSAANGPEGLDR